MFTESYYYLSSLNVLVPTNLAYRIYPCYESLEKYWESGAIVGTFSGKAARRMYAIACAHELETERGLYEAEIAAYKEIEPPEEYEPELDPYWDELEEPATPVRYTVMYEGYIFVGDSDGLNCHDYDSWEEVKSLINAYGDIITVRDNEYGVTWSQDEWY